MCPSAKSVVSCFAIVAMCRNRGIGFKNALPWRLKKEMAYFTRITSQAADGKQNAVVMGRNTWASIPPKHRPLSNRINIVVSKTLKEVPEGHHVTTSFPAALQLLQSLVDDGKVDKVFVVGGAQLYREALDSGHCTRIYLTEVDKNFECDVFFPEFDTSAFCPVEEEGIPQELQQEGDITYRFRVYECVQN